MRISSPMLAALLAGTILGTPLAAHAADEATPPPADSTASQGQIGEIVVTAARHEQSLQKVSAAVQVIDGSSLKEMALTNAGQIFADTPSIQATAQPGGFSIDVRGMGGDLNAGSTQGSTAMVFDGVYNINSLGATVGFFDVNRVEISPGPQSTRYGPDADGGVVNIYTNNPKLDKIEGSAAITLGDYNLVRGEAMINLPISHDLALRVSGAFLTRSSYFTPSQGDQRGQSVRAKLLYKPSDDFSLQLSYQMDHIGGAGNGSNTFPAYTDKVEVYSGGSINNYSNPWAAPGMIPTDNVNYANIYQHTFIANGSYQFSPAIALDVEASYIKMAGGETGTIYVSPWDTNASNSAAIFSGAQMNEFSPFHQFTTEVRFHNGAGSKVIWNLGYYHWDYLWGYSLENAGFLDFSRVETTTSQNAVFGEVTYPITSKLRVTGGLRESLDHRTFQFSNNGSLVVDDAGTSTFPRNFSHFDYRAGFEYDVAPRSMFYANISSGYRPGGYSGYSSATGGPVGFQSEVNTAEEIGIKNRFLNNHLQVNVDMFHYNISNYQNLDKYSGFVPSTGGAACSNGDPRISCLVPTFGVLAYTWGAETQIRALVTNDDVFHFNGTWLDARFSKKQGACATIGLTAQAQGMGCPDGYNDQVTNDLKFYDIAGAVQPHSPAISFTIGYDHTFHIAEKAKFSIGGSGFYSGGYWVNPVEDSDGYGYQPHYWLGEFHARLATIDDRWSVAAYIRNVGNYAVKESVLPATSLGDPRTFGVTLGAKY
jgi:iron complex outermembrane recepter protein